MFASIRQITWAVVVWSLTQGRAQAQPVAEGQPATAGRGQDWQLSVAFMQQEVLTAAFEAWSPYAAPSGYWSRARIGGGGALHSYYETTEEGQRRHVGAGDLALGYAMEAPVSGGVLFRSAFLGGYAWVDRHAVGGAEGPGQSRNPKSFGYFDTRHGVNLVLPTHQASGGGGDSLFELGVGFRWNFIGSDRDVRAGDLAVREMQAYPYLAAQMFL